MKILVSEIRPPITLFQHRGKEMDKKQFDKILKMAIENKVTDIIFAVGEPPMWRFSGSLMEMSGEALEVKDTVLLAKMLLESREIDFDTVTDTEVAYELEGVGRFRASIYKQRGV